ncbi:MAG: hypothetical protein J0I15_09670, partial [Herbaspirillum huttiense]|uniref:hypothetical protein n=1 Tax=Herbaspirillum huttiense TaxID=863372 RepID=UPI001ACD9CC0
RRRLLGHLAPNQQGQQLVEQSKVYVDIEAIKRSLRARLGSSYEQYKNALGQRDKRQDAEFLQFKDAILQKIESSSLSSVSLSTIFSKVYVLDNRTLTQSEIQFNALFSEITKEFLIGDHGLNAYLSTRVRHGKLVDALRKAVNDENLVTAQISGDSYAANVFWDERLSQFEYKDQLLEVLGIFCREFDATLYHVRDKLIHIRQIDDLHSKDENSEGLFPYHFSSLERRLMQTYDSDFKNLDQLIGKCVDILWEKTDLNLAKVRVELGNNVRTQLIAHFDKLNNDAMAICHNQIPSSFANAIAKARTATQQALENVITWFKRSEVYDRQDFHIDFPPQIAASMVRRTMSMPPEWTLFRSEVQEADDQLPGRTLDGLVDIFYVLLENAVKYAKSENIPLDVKLKLRYHEGKFVGEVQSKGCPPSTEQLQRLQQIRDSLATPDARKLAQREGKSGFRKIWMALDTPLYKSPQLDFTHQPSGDFLVLFSFSTVSTG